MKSRCCCSICLPPRKKNTTDIKSWLSALPEPDASCGAALPSGSIPEPRQDNGSEDCFDPGSSCGSNETGLGPWPYPYPAQTFETDTEATPVNVCGKHGFKVVQAKKYWNGRYGFVSDYVATPKLVTSKFKQYSVSTQIVEGATEDQKTWDSGGNQTYHEWANLNIDGQASSSQNLTAGGIQNCSGSASPSSGSGERHQRFALHPEYDQDFNYWALGSAPGILVQTGYQALIDAGFETYFVNQNTQKMKDSCSINSDRNIVRIPFLWNGNFYEGPANGFADWLAGFNVDDTGTGISKPVYEWEVSVYSNKLNYSISEFNVTEKEINFKIYAQYDFSTKIYKVDPELDPIPENGYLFNQLETHYTGTYHGNAKLDEEYTSQQCQKDCIALLNEWDMTDDTVYPWRTDSNCGVAPMVVLKETNGGIGYGYCDTAADSGLVSKFDGSIYGKPMAAAYYDKGWFDFYANKYMYSERYDGGLQLCYEYGQYAPEGIPTTATHWTDGANDTHYSGGYWQPFSRFKVNYIYDLPPFVNHGCAFVANNQEAFWASKWAEIKEPLPSQNYWGECGLQPNQCVIDDHGGAFASCEPMRDLVVLDALTCEESATIRYPNAFAICGKAAISNISVAAGVVTVIHSKTSLLRTGDKVDFIDASNAVTVSNITVTVDSDTQFHFTGSAPSGVAVISHGAPNPNWYDLSPKGDFVRVTDYAGTITANQGNVVPYAGKKPIIAIVPPGSPEINNTRWPARSTVIYSDYPSILPTESWTSSVQQGMQDRFWIADQDAKVSDGVDPDPLCAIKNKDGSACVSFPCDPVLTPIVEARLYAPAGAPMQFNSDNLPEWIKMPIASDFATTCSAVWTYNQPPATFYPQYGINPGLASSDRAASSNTASTDSNSSWGTADSTFIP